jgi:N-acetylglucosaminyl-diphospho-decaprenol L-rhamnosyltransferase
VRERAATLARVMSDTSRPSDQDAGGAGEPDVAGKPNVPGESEVAVEPDAAGDHDAAIVVVNYRTATLVERCLESVRGNSGGLTLETIVVDNDSRDGSAERLRAALPTSTVLAMPQNGGFAAGVNAGFRHSRASIVILLNPDTEVREGALARLVELLREQPRVGVAAPLLEDSEGQLTPNGYRRFPGLLTLWMDLCIPLGYALVYAPSLHPYAMSPAALRAGDAPAWVCGAALAIRRTAYEQTGPLDEGFFLYFEETEWQQRLSRLGWGIELVPSARVSHLVRGGGEDSLAHSPHFVSSALRYLHMRRVPTLLARLVLATSLTLSWIGLRLIACLPAKRASVMGQARAYRALVHVALTARP